MPEAPEVETENLREAIHEELEKVGGALLRQVALTTALLAALAAVSAQQAGGTANEALALRTEATQLQAQASDQWAYYQAKGIKAAVQVAVALGAVTALTRIRPLWWASLALGVVGVILFLFPRLS